MENVLPAVPDSDASSSVMLEMSLSLRDDIQCQDLCLGWHFLCLTSTINLIQMQAAPKNIYILFCCDHGLQRRCSPDVMTPTQVRIDFYPAVNP